MVTRTIYNSDSLEYYTDEDIIESLMEDGMDREEITDEDIYEERNFLSEIHFQDQENNLNKELDNDILVIASLGLWNGRKSGYKIIKGNLQNILYQACGDYYHVYYDGYNVVAKDCHHDGTNFYIFRIIKDNVNIDKLLSKIYNNDFDNKDINNYTKSLRSEVKAIYGW